VWREYYGKETGRSLAKKGETKSSHPKWEKFPSNSCQATKVYVVLNQLTTMSWSLEVNLPLEHSNETMTMAESLTKTPGRDLETEVPRYVLLRFKT
jgi:hypothetical protein